MQYFDYNINVYIYSFIDLTQDIIFYFFIGTFYGLDPNWDGTELMLAHYINNMSLKYSILLSCISTTGIIGIILMASPLMDKQINDISRQISENKPDNKQKIPMNLVCSEAKAHGVWNFWAFVYNEKDPSGAHLDRLFDRLPRVKQMRYIDGVGYNGFVFRPSIGMGEGNFSHFNFLGTKVKINNRVLGELQETHQIYSGFLESNPDLPRVGDTLFLRQFFDKAHIKKEDSYISDYESVSGDESSP